ncbi:MAG: hypothetical protein SF051_11455, partial [Elusimicrobiota bacterium]|nr:hypothetical protein [Elusimicrobiota bacterium]
IFSLRPQTFRFTGRPFARKTSLLKNKKLPGLLASAREAGGKFTLPLGYDLIRSRRSEYYHMTPRVSTTFFAKNFFRRAAPRFLDGESRFQRLEDCSKKIRRRA